MATKTLHDLFLNELKDIYNAEMQLTRALPKMAHAATNPELKQGFERHLKETKGHVERLDGVFESLDASSRGQTCEAMEGLLAEAQELTELGLEPDALDAALIAAAQKVEHYEIATYGTICTWAKAMKHDEALTLLLETLAEEKATDETLTKLAKTTVNTTAARHAHPRAA
ncbi:YciE/YciF ferroxidase family protein [Inquilinus sp. OTU3971]|uniref:YciE/YciF ferroxidase family protein n=1 Tax=Inquilinus sp. OTU3971 TaxID=3043855 RepID=UPI00313E6F01